VLSGDAEEPLEQQLGLDRPAGQEPQQACGGHRDKRRRTDGSSRRQRGRFLSQRRPAEQVAGVERGHENPAVVVANAEGQLAFLEPVDFGDGLAHLDQRLAVGQDAPYRCRREGLEVGRLQAFEERQPRQLDRTDSFRRAHPSLPLQGRLVEPPRLLSAS
jgi:hypothetical protein